MKGIGLASAFRTLTVLPVLGKDCTKQATTLYWFPVVGAVLGALCWCVAALVGLSPSAYSYLLAGPLVTATLALLTRGFHLDGLADMADGFGGGWTKERILDIMKDHHVGAFGAIALILTLLVKAVSISIVCAQQTLLWLVIVPVLSRTLLADVTCTNRYARSEMGTAGLLVSESRWYHGFVPSVIVIILMVFLLPQQFLYPLCMVLAGGVVTALYVSWRSRKRIGGVTGDVLGATCELCETAMFLVAALVGPI